MSYYIIRTRCPNGCKYKSGNTCVASECPYQTGYVRYDIRMNAEDKLTKINAQVKQAVKEFAERVKLETTVNNRLCVREYDIGYNDGYSEAYYSFHKIIDGLLKEYEK